MNDIWQRRGEIDRARSRKMQELMEEYDRTVLQRVLEHFGIE